jgi:UPF0716 protein FxsA
MFFRLFLLFTIIPLLELFILIKIGTLLGAIVPIFLVIATGIIGAYLARKQGFHVWRRIQLQMEQGVFPGTDLLEGLLILIAGFVLITPGIITDIFGFSLLIPFTRSLYTRRLSNIIRRMMDREMYSFGQYYRGQRMKRVNPEKGNYETDQTGFDDSQQ